VSLAPQIRPDQLDGYYAVDEHVTRAIDDAHAAFADARFQPITASDDFTKRGIVCPLA
jgi:hypothetical protein